MNRHGAALVITALLSMSTTACGPADSEPTTPAACKAQGGYWSARDCWWGEDAERYRCQNRVGPDDEIENGRYWDWDFDRRRCVLVTDSE